MTMMRFKRLIFIFLILLTTKAFSQSQSKWIMAAEKLEYEAVSSRNSKVIQGVAEMFPDRILEKMTMTLYRNLDNAEELDRKLYDLKKDRASLVLQLSSELKRRDSLVLNNYSQKELQKKIKEQEERIKDIKAKLQENRDKTAEAIENAGIVQNTAVESEKQQGNSELDKFSYLFKNIFVNDKNEPKTEKISLYKNDITARYESKLKGEEKDYTSKAFESEMVSNNINALMTGKLSVIEDYYFLTVDIYVYPGCRKIAAASEIGTLDEADFIASSIARQLTPGLTNALPVEINFNASFGEQEEGFIPPVVKTYIDSVVYAKLPENIVLQSGVHTLQFEAEGFKSCGTSYYFAGNRTYNIELNFERTEDISFTVDLLKPVDGNGELYVNGNALSKDKYGRSVVIVDGSVVLGQYTDVEKGSAFFYLPENKIENNGNYALKLNPVDRDAYIEKHRRRMYTSYSVLVTSLIPYFYCKGQADNYTNAYNLEYLPEQQINKANAWILSSNITAGISISAGVWFAYELVRYLIAANSVLPVQAKEYNKTDYEEITEGEE
ncbi:MAG: PEGA domain-containing protein [Treponema sp.]|nr:PEGA domain-containing protein [Treponema sp.]